MPIAKTLLSGSTGGMPIKVVATATTGTTIHATGTSASIIDEVWLYATNTSSAAVNLTIEFGSTTGFNYLHCRIDIGWDWFSSKDNNCICR